VNGIIRSNSLQAETYSVANARPIDEFRKELLKLRRSSAAFETGHGFHEADGNEMVFMIDMLFELRHENNIWSVFADGPFIKKKIVVKATIYDETQSMEERFRQVYEVLDLPVGYLAFFFLSYSAARFFEDLPGIIPVEGEPEVVLRVYRHVVRFTHDKLKPELTVLSGSTCKETNTQDILSVLVEPANGNVTQAVKPLSGNLTDITDRNEFFSGVHKAKKHILAGDIYQVQLSRKAVSDIEVEPVDLFDQLTQVNPAPYMYYADLGNQHLISASPELMIRCEEGKVQVRPIAGTMQKGESGGAKLGDDPKEAAEHLMLVDLARNDLARIAAPGTVQVSSLMSEESYGLLQHLVSTIEARTEADRDIWDLIAANFPAGTMTGAPKVRAMEIISDIEGVTRGAFSGCAGYISSRDGCVLALTIRTVVGDSGNYIFQAAAGVVADSTAEGEWNEAGCKIHSFARVMEQVI